MLGVILSRASFPLQEPELARSRPCSRQALLEQESQELLEGPGWGWAELSWGNPGLGTNSASFGPRRASAGGTAATPRRTLPSSAAA